METNKQQLLKMLQEITAAVEADTDDLKNIGDTHTLISNLDIKAGEMYMAQIDAEDKDFQEEMEHLIRGGRFN